jgi:hypothetical protein
VSAAGTLLSTAAGVGLIGLVNPDAFDALFHAEGRGMFSRQITRAVWQVFRRAGTRHERLSLAGPLPCDGWTIRPTVTAISSLSPLSEAGRGFGAACHERTVTRRVVRSS